MDAIVKELTVPLSPERAFQLFTEEMASWWPLDQHALSAPEGGAKDVTVPSEVGEQVLETMPDGSTAPWGRVTEHRPGRAFGMSWHVGRPEELATHVRVTFEAVADGTRVVLVHDGWAALGEGAPQVHAMYVTGWDFVFVERFGGAGALPLAAE